MKFTGAKLTSIRNHSWSLGKAALPSLILSTIANMLALTTSKSKSRKISSKQIFQKINKVKQMSNLKTHFSEQILRENLPVKIVQIQGKATKF
jgi:sulfite exporter TauE/SafE